MALSESVNFSGRGHIWVLVSLNHIRLHGDSVILPSAPFFYLIGIIHIFLYFLFSRNVQVTVLSCTCCIHCICWLTKVTSWINRRVQSHCTPLS